MRRLLAVLGIQPLTNGPSVPSGQTDLKFIARSKRRQGGALQDIRRLFAMKDLTNSSWIKVKGILFLILGILATSLLLLEVPSLKVGVLLALAIWGFCRFYYFAFYVIEHYVDPSYKFAGLLSFVSYLMRRNRVSQ